MFLMLDIGFFTLVVLFVVVKLLLAGRESAPATDPQPTPDAPATYRSEYADAALNGTSDETVDGMHKREIELRTTQVELEHSYKLEVLKRRQDTEIVQWALLSTVVMMYLITRLHVRRVREEQNDEA